MRLALLPAFLAIFLVPLSGAEPPLTLQAFTDREVYRESARNEIFVGARIEPAPSAAPAPAEPRNVALVIDRSGSMAGEPIAALRAAVASALRSLAPRDIVAVVAFGSELETVVEAQPRDRIDDPAARLARVVPAGGAALYDALNQGAAQLRRHATPTRLNHLVLVTDGPPTKGPREFDDFVHLAEAFASEGIVLSTIGLGGEFDEDVLAAMARSGHGHFRYAETPAALEPALKAAVAWNPPIVGHDAVLTFEFPRAALRLDAHGWRPATIGAGTVAFRFPRLFAGHDFGVLASMELDPAAARVFLPHAATVRLRWTDLAGESHEQTRPLAAHFTHDLRSVRESADPRVMHTAARILISEALQEAIEQVDAGDPRRALRTLRTARTDVRDLNADLAQAPIGEIVHTFDAWLAAIEPRGLSPADRKTLRSGLLHRFDPPHPDEDANR